MKEVAVMRTIRVTGKAQVKVHPDMTRITITLEGLHNEYMAMLCAIPARTQSRLKILYLNLALNDLTLKP